MPSGNAHMYRQLNGRRLLTGMVLAILTLGLIVIDLGMGSSGIGPGEVVDALLGGPDGDTANTAILWSATFVVDERRRKWLFIGNGCGAPVRLVLASHRTDDG